MKSGYKIATLVLSLLLILALAWIAYSYLVKVEQDRRLADLAKVETINGPLEKQLVIQQLKLDAMQQELSALTKELDTYAIYNDSSEGVYFEVQLGKFKQFSITEYKDQLINLHQETQEDLNIILLGRFTEVVAAEDLLLAVKKLGFKTAFITARINGRICDKEEALAVLQ